MNLFNIFNSWFGVYPVNLNQKPSEPDEITRKFNRYVVLDNRLLNAGTAIVRQAKINGDENTLEGPNTSIYNNIAEEFINIDDMSEYYDLEDWLKENLKPHLN